MRITPLALLLIAALAFTVPVRAQVPVTAEPDHGKLLASTDPQLAANKRLVYDFWRTVLEAGRIDEAGKYLADSYVQHNPTVPTGLAGFVAHFSGVARRAPHVADRVRAPLVAITAEGDRVVLAFVREERDAQDPSRTYTTTWFDMFRVENGRIAEHWDPATK